MELFDKLAAKGKVATDKAKLLAEIASLKSQIHTCEKVVEKNYLEIGRLYYGCYKDAPEKLFEMQCQAIDNAQNGIEELKAKIKQIEEKL